MNNGMDKSKRVEITHDLVGRHSKGEIVDSSEWEDEDYDRLIEVGAITPISRKEEDRLAEERARAVGDDVPDFVPTPESYKQPADTVLRAPAGG